MALDVDLNVPPSENLDQEGPSAHSNSLGVQVGQQGGSAPPAPIDVDAFDDDVVICSPRAFAEVWLFYFSEICYDLDLCLYELNIGSLILL